MDIKVIRLTSGEDIIGKMEFYDDEGFINIFDPMVFMLKDTGKSMNLLMQHWLPVSLLSENMATISSVNVLTVCDPNENFSEYYSNTVDKMNSVLQSRDELDEVSEEQANQILEAMEEIRKDNRLIH